MKFTRLQLMIICLGLIAAGAGIFVWILNLQQDFIADDSERLVVEHVSGNYSYTPIQKQDHIRDYATGNNSLYTADGKIRVNLNSADINELDRLPGVGPATARRMLEYRMMNGPFTSVDEITNIKGIGEKTLIKLRDMAFIGEPEPIAADILRNLSEPSAGEPSNDATNAVVNAPCGSGRININTATAAELETLPRIGPKTAAKIIADRETNGPFQDINDFTRVRGIGPKTLERMKDLICAE